jgi:hypothetical protein
VPGENLVGPAVPSDMDVPMIFTNPSRQCHHYKRPGARPITKMKTGQPESQNLAWGRPHFQSRKVCPSKLLFLTSCLSLLNKRSICFNHVLEILSIPSLWK